MMYISFSFFFFPDPPGLVTHILLNEKEIYFVTLSASNSCLSNFFVSLFSFFLLFFLSFHVVLRSSATSFIRIGLLFAELLFDFYAVRRYPVIIPLTAAGSLGAIRARGPSWSLNSGIRASVALVRCLLSNHRCCEP